MALHKQCLVMSMEEGGKQRKQSGKEIVRKDLGLTSIFSEE
jgi:hypothetical protein